MCDVRYNRSFKLPTFLGNYV